MSSTPEEAGVHGTRAVSTEGEGELVSRSPTCHRPEKTMSDLLIFRLRMMYTNGEGCHLSSSLNINSFIHSIPPKKHAC